MTSAAVVVALSAASSIACTSPTLPLPPPAIPTIFAGTAPNTFLLRSDRGALPSSLVIVINRDEMLPRDQRVAGTIADEQGSWELSVHGVAGDVIDISQESGTTRSPATTLQLK